MTAAADSNAPAAPVYPGARRTLSAHGDVDERPRVGRRADEALHASPEAEGRLAVVGGRLELADPEEAVRTRLAARRGGA